jgi:hypothetical protein
MKKLLVLLFSLFFFSSTAVFADDISDFSIEGISIGDSLLDYMSEDDILEEIENNKGFYTYLKEPNKYSSVYLFKKTQTYDKLSFFIKNNSSNQYISNNNEKYKILFVRGIIEYNQDFDSCLAKRNEIVKDLSGMFPNAQKIENVWIDESTENSIFNDVTFEFDSEDLIMARCNNWDENYRIKNNFSEGLHIVILTKEIDVWHSDYK